MTFLLGIRENVLCFECFFIRTPCRVRKERSKRMRRCGGGGRCVNELGSGEVRGVKQNSASVPRTMWLNNLCQQAGSTLVK